jgi:hypothetical protein
MDIKGDVPGDNAAHAGDGVVVGARHEPRLDHL